VHQAACAQFGAAKIARDHHHYITQAAYPAALPEPAGQPVSAGSPASLAVGCDAVAKTDQVDRDVVAGIRKLGFDLINKTLGLFDAEGRARLAINRELMTTISLRGFPSRDG